MQVYFVDMSKAFTREDDDVPDVPLASQPPPLPPGAKNYATERGARVLREELTGLLAVERPRVLSIGDATLRAKELYAVDQRMRYLEASLRTAVTVPTPAKPWEVVRFGATVNVREANGRESSYRIVGVDEADFDRGWISWCSPVARALLNARKGQRVRFQTPEGSQQLDIVDIGYE
jgi:transcription elongation factor GreB